MSWDEYVFEDPMESYERSYENNSHYRDYSSFTPDPLFYFTEVNYKIIGEMGDAYKLEIYDDIIWTPKALLKCWTDETVYIHTAFYEDKLYYLEED